MSRPIANQLAGLGYTKKSIREFLWQHARIPLAELRKEGLIAWMERVDIMPPYEDPWPITARPENIAIFVAGGTHPTHNLWMQTSLTTKMTSAEMKLPARWDALVSEAEEELGYGAD